jgi:hypothetical protein
MKTLNPKSTLILHPDILKVLKTFSNLIRNGQYMDCMSYVEGTHYMEIEAVVQPLQITKTKVLIPHHLILAVVDSAKKSKVGFDDTAQNKEGGSH